MGRATSRSGQLPPQAKQDLSELGNQVVESDCMDHGEARSNTYSVSTQAGTTEKDSKYYLDDRQITLSNGDVTPILKEEFKAPPPKHRIT
jgi:hypothetical protein